MSIQLPRLKFNCPADWGAMTGGDRVRHCSACDKAVHDLSAGTDADAARILASREGDRGPCVRAEVDADRHILTQTTRRTQLLDLLRRRVTQQEG